MEPKFTYLIGAGASANALPVVNKFVERINEFCIQLKSDLVSINRWDEHWITFTTRLKMFANVSIRFGTIDTLAKYYYLTNPMYLDELKRSLSIYFTFEQVLFGLRDNRYLQFLTTIMENVSMPEKLKILTWNYDFQFELAALNFKEDKYEIKGDRNIISSIPLVKYFPSGGIPLFKDSADKIDLLHLNGVAGLFSTDNNRFVESLFNDFDPNSIEMNLESKIKLLDVLDKYFSVENKIPLFSFAWEGNEMAGTDRIKLAENMIRETTHLVIIGYSFPFFNRNIDKRVLKAMLTSVDVEKIYYQDPNIDGQFLRKQFNIHKNCEIVHIAKTNNFFIPTEF